MLIASGCGVTVIGAGPVGVGDSSGVGVASSMSSGGSSVKGGGVFVSQMIVGKGEGVEAFDRSGKLQANVTNNNINETVNNRALPSYLIFRFSTI